jgi:hypothetical protein
MHTTQWSRLDQNIVFRVSNAFVKIDLDHYESS